MSQLLFSWILFYLVSISFHFVIASTWSESGTRLELYASNATSIHSRVQLWRSIIHGKWASERASEWRKSILLTRKTANNTRTSRKLFSPDVNWVYVTKHLRCFERSRWAFFAAHSSSFDQKCEVFESSTIQPAGNFSQKLLVEHLSNIKDLRIKFLSGWDVWRRLALKISQHFWAKSSIFFEYFRLEIGR